MKKILYLTVLIFFVGCRQSETSLIIDEENIVDTNKVNHSTDTIKTKVIEDTTKYPTSTTGPEFVSKINELNTLLDRMTNGGDYYPLDTSSDEEIAWIAISWAWGDHGPCTNTPKCIFYIGNIEIIFSNGKPSLPGQVVHRVGNSAHDCIQNALNALHSQPPNHGLAVSWVMASQIHNDDYYEWLRTHGDAVLAGLRRIH